MKKDNPKKVTRIDKRKLKPIDEATRRIVTDKRKQLIDFPVGTLVAVKSPKPPKPLKTEDFLFTLQEGAYTISDPTGEKHLWSATYFPTPITFLEIIGLGSVIRESQHAWMGHSVLYYYGCRSRIFVEPNFSSHMTLEEKLSLISTFIASIKLWVRECKSMPKEEVKLTL